MTKKLKIRFVKFECYLVAQQLEMAGKELFTPSEHVVLSASGIDFADAAIWLSRSCNFNIGARRFYHNDERDEYLHNVIKWISEEQFAPDRTLEIGETCLFSDDRKDWLFGKYAGKCSKKLGEPRFLTLSADDSLTCWQYVKPLCGALKIDGEVYTWEMEVAQ